MKKDGLSPDCKVDEIDAVSVLNRTPIFGSLLTLESFKFNGWVIHGDLAVVMMMFKSVTFTKVKLHPPSSIMRRAFHQAMSHLIFVPKVGKLGGNMWLSSVDQLVTWVLYNERTI